MAWHVTCDRVMSASVTLIGHAPTVTIHNRHPPPLSVSHGYCFHLIKYCNHNPFPMGPDTRHYYCWFSSWLTQLSVREGPHWVSICWWGREGQENGQVLRKAECLMMPHSHQVHHSLDATLYINTNRESLTSSKILKRNLSKFSPWARESHSQSLKRP